MTLWKREKATSGRMGSGPFRNPKPHVQASSPGRDCGPRKRITGKRQPDGARVARTLVRLPPLRNP
jgi:hypothetical protein